MVESGVIEPMNVNINFPAEIETTLLRRAAAAGKDVETLVKELVTERLAEESPAPAKLGSHDEFMAKLHEVIDLHPVSNGSMDDSRESIYAGRGE
jgi:plasmid stability protein